MITMIRSINSSWHFGSWLPPSTHFLPHPRGNMDRIDLIAISGIQDNSALPCPLSLSASTSPPSFHPIQWTQSIDSIPSNPSNGCICRKFIYRVIHFIKMYSSWNPWRFPLHCSTHFSSTSFSSLLSCPALSCNIILAFILQYFSSQSLTSIYFFTRPREIRPVNSSCTRYLLDVFPRLFTKCFVIFNCFPRNYTFNSGNFD